ncbi:MAG: fumarylacetoacetate hydrolase family protein [Gammaproteobacteria bacterium]|nr:fumarylacetoacetate hydrolase family protein [Gammaproteobacteria bacterium]
MGESVADLARWLDAALLSPEPVPEILGRAPNLTAREAHLIQFEIMNARVQRGDRIVGFKAALTSKAMQRETGIPEPLMGTLLGSRVFDGAEPVSLSNGGFLRPTLEPEVAVLLKKDLSGPGVQVFDALAAIEGYFPAVELGDYRYLEGTRVLQDSVACNTYNGGTVIGGPMSSPAGLDLRTEGMTMSLNGEPCASGTGVEVLGDPLNSVVFLANKLAEFDLSLKAGMVLLTGSITRSISLSAGDHIRVEFTRLGQLDVRISA